MDIMIYVRVGDNKEILDLRIHTFGEDAKADEEFRAWTDEPLPRGTVGQYGHRVDMDPSTAWMLRGLLKGGHRAGIMQLAQTVFALGRELR